jgi:hypothetical protein
MRKCLWVIILLGIGQAVCFVITFTGLGDLRHERDTYKEKYEVAISERDYYKKLAGWEHGFDFETFLPDGISVSIRVNYQEGYPMSVDQRLLMTIAMRDALSNEKVIPRKFKE